MNFANILVSWYLENKRPLPWRDTTDPYKIWLSEIILQQTRVEQGMPYYLSFVKSFPDVFALAAATEEEVLKLWQGLGYYSRARNLHASAKYVAYELKGVFPKTCKELLSLKGVGDYTASAIASICYNEPVAVVDGNVYRVLSRIYGIDTPINSTEGVKQFKQLAQELLDKKDPANFNQGIMEFGATHCKPQNPLCERCPFASRCVAFNQNLISDLPVKLKKQKVKNRYFNYLVFISEEGETVLEQRKGKGIWEGLYEFPLVETSEEIGMENLVEEAGFQEYAPLKGEGLNLYNENSIVHKLSHQHIHTKFWILNCDRLPQKGIPVGKMKAYPVPRLIDKFIESYNF